MKISGLIREHECSVIYITKLRRNCRRVARLFLFLARVGEIRMLIKEYPYRRCQLNPRGFSKENSTFSHSNVLFKRAEQIFVKKKKEFPFGSENPWVCLSFGTFLGGKILIFEKLAGA